MLCSESSKDCRNHFVTQLFSFWPSPLPFPPTSIIIMGAGANLPWLNVFSALLWFCSSEPQQTMQKKVKAKVNLHPWSPSLLCFSRPLTALTRQSGRRGRGGHHARKSSLDFPLFWGLPFWLWGNILWKIPYVSENFSSTFFECVFATFYSSIFRP